jgi:hypothetical protein
MGNFITCTHHNLYSSPDIIRQIKSRRMRWMGLWYTWERAEKCTGFRWESLKERDHLEDQGIGGRMGLEQLLGNLLGGGVDWIHLAQDRDEWRALMNAVMNLWVLAPQS